MAIKRYSNKNVAVLKKLKEIDEKLVKMEKNNRLIAVFPAVFFLLTVYLTIMTFAFDSNNFKYFYVGLGVFIVAVIILVWGIVEARQK